MENITQHRTILILSANPKNTTRIRIDQEVREIKYGLRRSKFGNFFSVNSAEALRDVDLSSSILEYKPNIIHFSGHGTGIEGLVFEDEIGQARLINTATLAEFFRHFSKHMNLECVVINACYSEYQAQEIAKYIKYVVGISNAIEDGKAIKFSQGFYNTLGWGYGYEMAYNIGCCHLGFTDQIPQNHLPKLFIDGQLVEESPSIDKSQTTSKKPLLEAFTPELSNRFPYLLNNLQIKLCFEVGVDYTKSEKPTYYQPDKTDNNKRESSIIEIVNNQQDHRVKEINNNSEKNIILDQFLQAEQFYDVGVDFTRIYGFLDIDYNETLIHNREKAKYTQLESLLSQGRWKEADQETAKVILKIANRQQEGFLDPISIEKFPLRYLQQIDQLWVNYSNNRFGFSIQKRILTETIEQFSNLNGASMNNFYERIGWIKNGQFLDYDNLDFEVTAPEGGLPMGGCKRFVGFGIECKMIPSCIFISLLSHLYR